MLDHFRDTQKMQEILREAQTGLWVIELDDDREPRMYADSSMLELLGFEAEPTPERCYQVWYDRIEDEYYPIIQSGVEKMSAVSVGASKVGTHFCALRGSPGLELQRGGVS